MLIHRKKRSRYTVNTPLTALIDIVFLLLIYFLLTTNFLVDEGITVKLPQAKAAAPQTEEVITIIVDAAGDAYIKHEKISPAALFDRLQALMGPDRDELVVVRADRTVMLNRVVKVMDIAKAAGAGRLCLATEKDF
jgi:biopolymer transport protein ExbD